MKRRSFLAMLGLAPVAGVEAAESKSVNRQLLDGDIPIPAAAVTEVWSCAEYVAACAAARAAGAPAPETRMLFVAVDQSEGGTQFEKQLVTRDGRVVYRERNRK